MDVHIFTPEFEFLHTENKITSLIWHTKYDDYGTLELHTDTKNDMIPFVLPQAHSDIIVVQGDNAAWVHGETDISGRYDFMLTGKTLNFMLEWRAVNPFTTTNSIENIIRAKITEQFMTPGSDKYIASFFLAPAIGGTDTVTYEFEDKQKSLFDVVQELCKMGNLGFRVNFDFYNGKYIFELYRGTDMTADQKDAPPVVISEINRNMADSQYLFNQLDYYSCGYLKQTNEQTEAVTWLEIEKDDKQGFYRREKILSSDNEAEAGIELGDSKKVEQIEGNIMGDDVDILELGDMITVQKKVGNILIAQNKRITEIIQTIERLNSSIRPVLDDIIGEVE